MLTGDGGLILQEPPHRYSEYSEYGEHSTQ
jgi:hypothetical protein